MLSIKRPKRSRYKELVVCSTEENVTSDEPITYRTKHIYDKVKLIYLDMAILMSIIIIVLYLSLSSFRVQQKEIPKKILAIHSPWAESFMRQDCERSGKFGDFGSTLRRFNYASQFMSQNFGNAVWSEAAYRLVDRNKWDVWNLRGLKEPEEKQANTFISNIYCQIMSCESCPSSKPELSYETCGPPTITSTKYIPCIDAVMIPTANVLQDRERVPEKWMGSALQTLSSLVKTANKPTLLVGIGIQAEFSADKSDVSANLYFNEESVEFLNSIEQRSSGGWLARGNLTTGSAKFSGAPGGRPVGCPSLFLNPDPCLGRMIQMKFKKLAKIKKQSWQARQLRIAVLLPTRALQHDNSEAHAAMANFLRTIFLRYPNAFAAAQNYHSATRWFTSWNMTNHRQRFFLSIDAWKRHLEHTDLVFGGRIHGTMMGVAAGKPTVSIANDARILEMTRAMKLPHIEAQDFIDNKHWEDVLDIVRVKAKDYSGKAWDENRSQVMRTYYDVFSKAGLDIEPTRLALANSTCEFIELTDF